MQQTSNPDKLVCHRIKHLFDCDGEEVWFKGTVLAYNQNNHEFTIAYDIENEVFSFPLLEDLKCGDILVILSINFCCRDLITVWYGADKRELKGRQ